MTLLVIVLSALLYALVAEAKAGGQPVDEDLLVNASMILYVGSLVPCVFCLVCSEMEP
jgi:hypothetical protein